MRARSVSARRGMDMTRFAQGLRTAGVDLRFWMSYATVAVVDDETGRPDFTNPNAIVVTPSGAEVDVVLEPSGQPMTARWGWGGGRVTGHCPLEPGDQVILGFPDGDASMVPQVLAAVSGASAPLPVGDDDKPVFQNDRLLVHARGVPVDVRTDGGARVLLDADGGAQLMNGSGAVRIDPDGTVRLHGAGASEQYVKGTTFLDALTKVVAPGPPLGPDTGLLGAFTALAAAAVGPLAAFQPGFQTAVLALTQFNAKLTTFLSDDVLGE